MEYKTLHTSLITFLVTGHEQLITSLESVH